MTISNNERQAICDAAAGAIKKSYSPYSGSRVGAAVLGSGLHIGANIENASYGASLCAERSALAAARIDGDTDIRAIAIFFADAGDEASPDELIPCGLCQQWIIELAPHAQIFVCNTNAEYQFPNSPPPGFELKPLPVRVKDKGEVDPAEEERKP